jgi:2-iminobutanoate/2-iminopropanoate deaminase
MALSENVYLLRPKLETDIGFAQAVRAGDLLFISGSVSWDQDGTPIDVGDMTAQLRNCYADIEKTLKAHGLGFENLVKETIFTRDMAALVKSGPARAEVFAHCAAPASTWIQISSLVAPELLLEIEAVASFK